MTENNIEDEIRALLEKATPRPWNVAAYYTHAGTPDELCRGMIVDGDDWPIGIVDENDAGIETLSNNLALIVALVNNAEAILDENRSLKDRVRALEEGLRRIEKTSGDSEWMRGIARGLLQTKEGEVREPGTGWKLSDEAKADLDGLERAQAAGAAHAAAHPEQFIVGNSTHPNKDKTP